MAMFAIQMERSRSDSSASSSSSTLSLSPYGWTPRGPTLSPPTTTTAPYSGSLEATRTKAAHLTVHRPTTKPRSNTAPYALTYETFAPTSGRCAYAYPHWPAGDSLSANSSPSNGRTSHARDAAGLAAVPSYAAPPSSKISDEDLAELDFSAAPQPPCALDSLPEMTVGHPHEAAMGISWSQVGGQMAAPAPEPRRRRLPPPPAGFVMHGDSHRRSRRSPSRPRNGNESAIC